MRFETQVDIDRETKAIKTFCNAYNLKYNKLSDWDIDFLVYNDKFTTHAEVKGRLRLAKDSYPLPLAIRKVYKLSEASKDPVIIWACNDGILYAKLVNLKGEIRKGGRNPRQGSANDIEMMAYYPEQDDIKFLKYDI